MEKGLSRYVSILMLVLLVVNMSSPVSVYFSYQLNKEYIATQLCENRDRPELACNGQCILMKKLQEFNKQTTSASSSQFALPSLSFDYLRGISLEYNLTALVHEKIQLTIFSIREYFFQYISLIGHPPQVVV
ncbi:MAG: hypothetical protein AB8B61_10045 [Cyclobacteriaceae bacterium]